jgi:hypothetical protein
MLCHMRRASVFYSPRQRASGARVNAGLAAPTRISSRCIGNIGGLNIGWSRSSLARPARWSPRAPCHSALIPCWQDLRQRSPRGVDAGKFELAERLMRSVASSGDKEAVQTGEKELIIGRRKL